MNIWGPFCWMIDPITPEQHQQAMKDHARQLGFADAAALDEAQNAGNLAANGDEMAALAMRYIRRDIARVAASRAAAGAPRRGKWKDLKPEAVKIIARIRSKRSDLKVSSVAENVMDELASKHTKTPPRTTIMRWVEDFDR